MSEAPAAISRPPPLADAHEMLEGAPAISQPPPLADTQSAGEAPESLVPFSPTDSLRSPLSQKIARCRGTDSKKASLAEAPSGFQRSRRPSKGAVAVSALSSSGVSPSSQRPHGPITEMAAELPPRKIDAIRHAYPVSAQSEKPPGLSAPRG